MCCCRTNRAPKAKAGYDTDTHTHTCETLPPSRTHKHTLRLARRSVWELSLRAHRAVFLLHKLMCSCNFAGISPVLRRLLLLLCGFVSAKLFLFISSPSLDLLPPPPSCHPPLGWCDLRLCLKTGGLGCYLRVIDASWKSHCPHATGGLTQRWMEGEKEQLFPADWCLFPVTLKV